MFNNTLPGSAAFHSCGRLCPPLKRKRPHTTRRIGWCLQRRNLQLGLRASCYETTTLFLAVDPVERLSALKLPNAQAGKQGAHLEIQHEVYASFRSRVARPSTA